MNAEARAIVQEAAQSIVMGGELLPRTTQELARMLIDRDTILALATESLSERTNYGIR